MAKPVVLFLLAMIFTHRLLGAEPQPYIISGFDDVLRQAENTSLVKAAFKILEDDKGFSGMPQLYQAISNQEVFPQFVLVSAISNWFDSRIDRFLTTSHYPSNRRYLRNWLTEWSIESFKIEKIRLILNQKIDRKFIIIFDNSEASLKLAAEIQGQFSKNAVAIYLRQVQNKKIPAEAMGFYTAFDIALNEFKHGRLSTENVLKIGQTILNEQDINAIIPTYASCPVNDSSCTSDLSTMKDFCLKVRQHIGSLCKR